MSTGPLQRTRRQNRYASFSILKALLFAALVYSSGAEAGESATPTFSFGGFGTLGVLHSDEDHADYVASVFAPHGAGHTASWTGNVDTKLAAQLSADFTPQLSAVVQVLSEQLYDKTYSPQLEWANIKYQLTPELSLRAGRIVVSAFMFSDTRKVGYATPWVRPPVEVYNFVPISNSDGVDASYRLVLGDFIHTFIGSYGKGNPGVPARAGGGRARSRNIWVISDTIEYGALTAHLAYQDTRLTVAAVNALFDAFRQFGPEGIAIADRYEQVDKPLRFIGLSAQYDPGKWFVLSEWGHVNFHSLIGRSTGWYVTGGYRLRSLTPYLSYSTVKQNSNTSDPGLTLSALPPYLVGPATQLNAGLNALLGSVAATQNTVSAGARWDVHKNVVLKLQYDRLRLGKGSPGTLVNVQPEFQTGGRVSLVSATCDFVF